MRRAHRKSERLNFVQAGSHQKGFSVVAELFRRFDKRIHRAVYDGDDVFRSGANLHADNVERRIRQNPRHAQKFAHSDRIARIFASGDEPCNLSDRDFFRVARPRHVDRASLIDAGQKIFDRRKHELRPVGCGDKALR